MNSKENIRPDVTKSQWWKIANRKYDLKKTWVGYKPIKLLKPEDSSVLPIDDPLYHRIKALSKGDISFFRRLKSDNEFHDVFWNFHNLTGTLVDWSPSTEAEEKAVNQINKAIEDRLECTFAQKLLLEKYYSQLSKQEQQRLLKKANATIMNAEPWLQTHHPNYSHLYYKLTYTFVLKFK